MAPLKKDQDDSLSSKNHQKKTKHRRSSNKLNVIYKHLENLCDAEAKKTANNPDKNSFQKKGHKQKLDDKSKYADSEKSYRASDSGNSSDDEEFDDGISESSTDSAKKDSNDDTRVQSIIRKALDIGVQNGYLIPTDTSYRILRVASNLVELENRKRKHQRSHSNDTNGENDEVVDKRRKRRRSKGRKRRRRSHGRSRRRPAKNEELEEMAEDHEDEEDEDEDSHDDQEDEEEMDKKTSKQEEDKGNVRKARSNAPDREVKDVMKKENTDDEGSDGEQEKKG